MQQAAAQAERDRKRRESAASKQALRVGVRQLEPSRRLRGRRSSLVVSTPPRPAGPNGRPSAYVEDVQMIHFSNDAVGVEFQLHQAFGGARINQVTCGVSSSGQHREKFA